MSASTVRASSTSATTSTLRPRTRRLISGLDEGDESSVDPTNTPAKRIASPILGPIDRRSKSPIPASHLPRFRSGHGGDGTQDAAAGASGPGRGTGVRRLGDEGPTSLERLWGTSWTAIQGIASELLGSDAHQGPPLAKGKVPRTRRSATRLHSHRASTSAPPSTWGPKVPTIENVGTGSREETESMFRAQKRKDMLLNQESSYTDTLGRFKRRMSDDGPSFSAPPVETDGREALVYLHHVQQGDTLAGLTIKYSCSANALRKANRMWPNDVVQTRSVILLPVDACGVKGKPVTGPEAVDLLSDENAAFSAGLAEEVTPIPQILNGNDSLSRPRSNSNFTSTSSSVARSNLDSEPPWHHDSWVLLSGYKKPVEIVRLSRISLGYFPPARRKSNGFSDIDSPSTSFDNPRHLVAEALTQPSHSPTRQEPGHSTRRNRRPSNAVNGYFPTHFTGPGGVGTMDRNVRAPGPAQDGLNKMFAKHLPDVAPPRNQHVLYQPEMPLFTDDPTPTASGQATPSGGVNKNLEHMGGAIEAWMRRVASKAKDAMEPSERQRAARASDGTSGRGAGDIGDLIEMTNDFEIGEDDDFESRQERGRTGSLIDFGGGGGGGGHTTTAASNFPETVRHREAVKQGKID